MNAARPGLCIYLLGFGVDIKIDGKDCGAALEPNIALIAKLIFDNLIFFPVFNFCLKNPLGE